MNLGRGFSAPGDWSLNLNRLVLLPLLALVLLPLTSGAALPKRLVLALDGVGYADMKALQQGVTYTNLSGRQLHRQAFHRGYFPVSRMVSTFPSASDVAWTEILGDRPLPGYQRTYFCQGANLEVYQNGVTTTMEYERQMTWQVSGGLLRTLGYIFPRRTFKYEAHELVKNFLNATDQGEPFYAYIRSPDDAQHLSADILAMLCTLDERLQQLRALYREREGRELEILILSDHGNNHAGPAKRLEILPFLKQAGYRVAESISGPKDIVLPTAGMESWVEMHNSPSETERLLELLSHLEGVDVLTAKHPTQANRFIVMNAQGERATIDWHPAQNAFRYTMEKGDPLGYRPAVKALARKHQLGPDNFASAEAWMAETVACRYPVALERIVRGHTHAALNPATILISTDNRYLHSGWFVKKGSEVVRFGGTHGGLDDINSTGILLSTFAPTQDTCANRVAALYNHFPGMRNYRAEESGAEWVSVKAQRLVNIPRSPLDAGCGSLPNEEVLLRIWGPELARVSASTPIELTVREVGHFVSPQIRRGDPPSIDSSERRVSLSSPVALPGTDTCERVYAFPTPLKLDPEKAYQISGRLQEPKHHSELFSFVFRTDKHSQPLAY